MADKPPLKFRLLAKIIGGDMPKVLENIWKYFDGAKTYIGLVITLVAFLAGWIPELLNTAHANPDTIAKIVGALVTVLGLLDRARKALGIPASK